MEEEKSLLMILNKDEPEVVNSVFSLALTAAASGTIVSIFALASGTSIFTKEKASDTRCCGMSVEDIVADIQNIKVCLCVESEMCKLGKEDILPSIKVVDILELLQMIEEYDRVITF